MSNTNNIIGIIDAGIKAESLRQKAIANNVANAETPGYRRIDVRFEELLARHLGKDVHVELTDIQPEIYQPMETAVKSNGNDVNWQNEVGNMVKNSLRHKAYVRFLEKKYRQIELAIDVR